MKSRPSPKKLFQIEGLECAANGCGLRIQVIKAMTETERYTNDLISRGQLREAQTPLHALRNLGTAAVGGPLQLSISAADFAQTMALICCNAHFAPTESSRFSQREMRNAAFRLCGPFTVKSMTSTQAQRLMALPSANPLFTAQWKKRRSYTRALLSHNEIICDRVLASDYYGRRFDVHIHSNADSSLQTAVQLSQPFVADKDMEQHSAARAFLYAYNLLNGNGFPWIPGDDRQGRRSSRRCHPWPWGPPNCKSTFAPLCKS